MLTKSTTFAINIHDTLRSLGIQLHSSKDLKNVAHWLTKTNVNDQQCPLWEGGGICDWEGSNEVYDFEHSCRDYI